MFWDIQMAKTGCVTVLARDLFTYFEKKYVKVCYDRQNGQKERYYHVRQSIFTYSAVKLFLQEVYVKVVLCDSPICKTYINII